VPEVNRETAFYCSFFPPEAFCEPQEVQRLELNNAKREAAHADRGFAQFTECLAIGESPSLQLIEGSPSGPKGSHSGQQCAL